VRDLANKQTAQRDAWMRVLDLRAGRSGDSVPDAFEPLFGPLLKPARETGFVIGQLGQSLDGRIAAPGGDSYYINGSAGLDHLHRLRAMVDAVVVGVGTVVADDPQLTVRRVEGCDPARIVVDPSGRTPAAARALAGNSVRRIVVVGVDATFDAAPGVEVLRLPTTEGRFAPQDLRRAFTMLGFARVLVEGGARTVSGFIAAGCLDRLHVAVAPVILGSGLTGLTLPPIDRVADALRPSIRAHILDDPQGDEVVFDCDFGG
jgi:diaminohydroxyphosphoribosylaminopyrimidine deaminase / 5-amino-6-(5-phosphoribosylamino)uracil reductase